MEFGGRKRKTGFHYDRGKMEEKIQKINKMQ